MMKHLRSLRYLVRQGLAIRGHDDKEDKWLEECKYISPQIVNEQVKMLADQVLRNLLEKIHSAPWFAVLTDEATMSIDEQLCLIMRWINNDYEISEDPIGFSGIGAT